jgi:hypothetical protein
MPAKCTNWLIFALKYILMYTLTYLFGPKFTRKDSGNALKTILEILEKSWNFVGFVL